jgi:TonB family protein
MIPRTLVPTDVRPVTAEDAKKRGKRITTYMDDRTVVPSELSDAPPLTGATSIPEHLPLGVLVDRTLVGRGMAATPFPDFGPINERSFPIDVLDTRVVVPAWVEPPDQSEIDKFDQPPQMTAQLRELVEPDIFNTGEANLLVEPEEKRDAKWDAITRVLSIAGHILFIIFLVFLPKLFPPHIPTTQEVEMDSKLLGKVYLPPDAGELSRRPLPPGPKVKIDNKTLNKVAPPRAENHAAPEPVRPPVTPPVDLPSAPTPRTNAISAPAVVPPPVTPPPTSSVLLPAAPAAPNRKLNLGLNNSSPNRSMQDQLQDAVSRAGSGGGTYSSEGGLGSGQNGGGGGHGGQVGNGAEILTDTQGVDFSSYMTRLIARVKRNWMTVMPESVYLGDKGVVAITFRINRDGSFPGENLYLERTSGKDPLDTAAMSAIRSTSPFEPLPPQFKGPYIDLRFGFYYNLKPPGQ